MADEIFRKHFIGIELKKDKEGAFTAKIATLNVIDKDGDVTLPGAFPQGKQVLISSYMHGSWSGNLPVGKGVIREEGDSVYVDGEFNLKTDIGREHYETVKFAPELTQWSYGFKVLNVDHENPVWKDNPHVWRVLKQLDPFEASPVLLGAGVDTRTVAIKSETGQSLADEFEAVLTAAGKLSGRVKALAALRSGEGKAAMSVSTRERMQRMMSQMGGMMRDMQEMMDEMEPPEQQQAAVDDGKSALAYALALTTKIKISEAV